MNFLDKLGQISSQTYKYTQEKTTKIAKIAKLKALMNEDKQKVEDLYNEIGKKLYENHVRAEKIDIVSKIEDICKEIDAYADEIELTRKEILKLKDLKQCKKCSYEMELEYKFCPNCGEEQKEVLENKEENSENVSNVKKENEEDK
ncbi:MAG: hypothetical protein U0O04_04690 [Clostridia bacterium]|jgi:Zn finger protein HypA/HybF involved in hydrogenase expression|nr:zinc ribbon domain-containing protein [Clostridiaceae bacterium]